MSTTKRNIGIGAGVVSVPVILAMMQFGQGYLARRDARLEKFNDLQATVEVLEDADLINKISDLRTDIAYLKMELCDLTPGRRWWRGDCIVEGP